MQVNRNLTYEVVSRNVVGEGKIENIKNTLLNRKFQLLSEKDDSFAIELKLNSPAIVTKIEMRLIRTYRFSMKLINAENKLVQEFAQLVQKGQDEKIVISPTKTQSSTFVKLKIDNDPFNKQRIGICYVKFEGFSDQNPDQNKRQSNKDKTQSHIKNQDLHIKSNIKKDPKSINSKDLFKERQKQNVKNDVKRLLSLAQYDIDYGSKKTKHNESISSPLKSSQKKEIDRKLQEKQDTDLAIALSQSEQQRISAENDYEVMQMEEFQKKQEDSLPQELKRYADEMLEIPDRKYQTVDFNEEYINIFSDLSPKWLEAHKIAEQQAEVRQQQRLSKYVRLKYLVGVQVYIADFPEWKVQELKHQAKELGCRILPQLKNHCLAIVPRDTCERLRKKHRTWNQIKFIQPQYLQDCAKHHSRLPPKDYYIKI